MNAAVEGHQLGEPTPGASPPPAGPPAEPKPDRQESEYVVLQEHQSAVDSEQPVYLTLLGSATVSGGPRRAIEAVIAEKNIHEGTFFAIPARSFKPFTRKVETKATWTLP